ncbi:Replication protein C (RepC) [compost metagenome]
MAILLLHESHTITDVHRNTGAARSTIGRWLNWYRDEGVDALASLPAGRTPVLPVAKIVTALVSYAFPDKSSAATDRKRQSRVRKALDELAELGWSISEHAKGRFTIGRPALSR